jgi:PAS domain S-box-containing protein
MDDNAAPRETASLVSELSVLADKTDDRAEQAHTGLQASESRFRGLFEAAQDGLLLLNHDTSQIEDVNPHVIGMLGYSHAEFVGKKPWELNSFSDIAQCRAMFSELQSTGFARYDNVLLKTKAGARIEVEFVGHSYECAGVRVAQCAIRDITERRIAEHGRRAADERLRALTEQRIVGIYIVQEGIFTYMNPRGAEIVGEHSPDAVVGTDPVSWVVEADRSKLADAMRRLFSEEVLNLNIEFGVMRRDGVATQVSLSACRVSNNCQPALIGLMQDISERKRAQEQIENHLAQLKLALMTTVDVAMNISEMRDRYTAGHERRVAKIATAIGAELGFDADRLQGLQIAGQLHDVGKIAIPSEILSKFGKLNAAEMNLIRGHAQASYDLLKDVQFPWPVAQVALQHHERMDGSGYPQGLKGDAILLEARIIAVADVVEAMISHRPYRPALGIDTALAEIGRGRGTAYDAGIADACLRLFRQKGYQVME